MMSWDEIRKALTTPTFGSSSRSRLGIWIVDEVQRQFGSGWLECASRPGPFSDLVQLHSSNPAFFTLLTPMLQLASTGQLPGRRTLIKALRRNSEAGSWLHPFLQLEVAVLAHSIGWQASFEERLAPGSPPVDIVLRGPMGMIPVEAKVVLMSEPNREITQEHSQFKELLMRLVRQYDVIISGNLPGIPTEQGRAAIESAVVAVAHEVAANRASRTVMVERINVNITVTWVGAAPNGTVLTMPGPLDDDADRLSGKITTKDLQATKSGARWLRLDMVGGYFQYSPWWDWPFARQVDAIVSEVQAAAQASIFDGVVVSSGRVGPGTVQPGFVQHFGGAIGLRQQLDPLYSRTTVVLPLSAVGSTEVATWNSIYAAEAGWLDATLSALKLPSIAQVMSEDR